MAHFLRLKLHALCSSRFSSPALASKLLKSPDPRLTAWRWYGEGALLEDHGDGGSMPANQALAKDLEEFESFGRNSMAANQEDAMATSRQSADFSILNSDELLESSLGKLTNLVTKKSEANPDILHLAKDSTHQNQSDQASAEGTSKSGKDDKWHKMVSSIRSIAHKKKLKAGDANNWGSPKAGQIESQLDFSDLDLPQAGGVSEGPTVSRRELSASNTSSKSTKQKNTQSQSLTQQKSKYTLEDAVSLDPHSSVGVFDKRLKQQPANQKHLLDSSGASNLSDVLVGSNLLKPKDHSSQHKNQQRYKDSSLSNSKSKEYSVPKELLFFEENPSSQDSDRARKNQARPPFSKLPQGSDGATMSAKGSSFSNYDSIFLHDRPSKNEARDPFFKGSDDAFMSGKGTNSPISREAAHEASSNSDGVSKQTYMVCIQNLPPTCNPSMVKASMAIHGEVTGFFKKPVRDRLTAYIQFKTAEAMESALASRKLQLGSKTCYITRSDQSVFTTVVRVSKVSNDTDEGQLRSVCEQYGKVDDIRKRAYGVFDVFYDVKELTNIPNILSSLSEVNLNRSTWFALPAPLVHPSVQKEVLKSLEGQSWHDIQVNHAINRIEAGLDVVSVLFEDLKQLNLVAREYSTK